METLPLTQEEYDSLPIGSIVDIHFPGGNTGRYRTLTTQFAPRYVGYHSDYDKVKDFTFFIGEISQSNPKMVRVWKVDG